MNGHPARNRQGAIPAYLCAAVLTLAALPIPGLAANADAGRTLFRQQCTVCHTAEADDNGGAQGPSLRGVFGRRAASDSSFGYTSALQSSKLTWDADTLNRFLASPSRIVPGTAMAVAVEDRAKRADLVAYLESETQSAQSARNATASGAAASAEGAGATPMEGDWKKDVPGRPHRIDLNSLPPPFSTSSSRNPPRLIPRPAGAELLVPPGFKVGLFAGNLLGPRRMIVAANGDIFVTEMQGGRVSVLHPAPDGRTSARADVYADGLNRPFGIEFYPSAEHPQWLYVAQTNRVIRYEFQPGDVKARGVPEVVVPSLPSGGGHVTRDIAFSPDGHRMFVSVGSASNYAEQISKKTPAQVREWESTHALGSAWDMEENREGEA